MLITDETLCKHLDLEMADDRYACLLHSSDDRAYVCDDYSERIGINWSRGHCTVRVRFWLEIHSFAQLELSTPPRVALEEAVEFS
jgi:hypothetical protein